MKILQFSSPLFFLNKDLFKESVLKKCVGGQKFRGNRDYEYGDVRILIVDCSAMSFVDSAGVATMIEVGNRLAANSHRIPSTRVLVGSVVEGTQDTGHRSGARLLSSRCSIDVQQNQPPEKGA